MTTPHMKEPSVEIVTKMSCSDLRRSGWSDQVNVIQCRERQAIPCRERQVIPCCQRQVIPCRQRQVEARV